MLFLWRHEDVEESDLWRDEDVEESDLWRHEDVEESDLQHSWSQVYPGDVAVEQSYNIGVYSSAATSSSAGASSAASSAAGAGGADPRGTYEGRPSSFQTMERPAAILSAGKA